MLPSEVEEIGVSDYDLLERYWNEEPWGTWRDNLHAAVIAREVHRTAFKGPHKLEDYMITVPKKQVSGKADKEGLFDMLRTMAGGKRTKKAK